MIPAVVAVPSSIGMRGQVQLLQHVVLRAEDAAGRGEQQHDEQADEPDGEALAGAVEAGHPAGDVAAGQVGEEEDDEDGDAAADAERLGLVGRLVGGVDALGQPEGHARRRTAARRG